MCGKLGMMLKRHDSLIARCLGVRRNARTRRIWKKQQKAAEVSWAYTERLAKVAFLDGPDRAGK